MKQSLCLLKHKRSNVKISIYVIMQIYKKIQILKYFGFQILGLRMLDIQILKFD